MCTGGSEGLHMHPPHLDPQGRTVLPSSWNTGGSEGLDGFVLPTRRSQPVVLSLGEEPWRSGVESFCRRRPQAPRASPAQQPAWRAFLVSPHQIHRCVRRPIPQATGPLQGRQRETTDRSVHSWPASTYEHRCRDACPGHSGGRHGVGSFVRTSPPDHD